jgi:hypothetical protein
MDTPHGTTSTVTIHCLIHWTSANAGADFMLAATWLESLARELFTAPAKSDPLSEIN